MKFLSDDAKMLIKNMLYGYYNTQCIYAVSKLDIAEHLKVGNKSINELASLTHCEEDKLFRIMRFLAAQGLFDELPEQIFGLNEQSNFLLSSTPGNLKKFIELHGLYFYQGAASISASMQNELTPFEISFGKPAWKLFEEQPAVAQIYNLAMQEVSEYYGRLVVQKYNFLPYKMIVDVGGGFGSFLVTILKSNLGAKGIDFDLPSLQASAESYFNQEDVALRCQFIGGSFFDAIPVGGDLYLFKAIFHGKTDEQALLILNNAKRVLSRSSKILLIERMMIENSTLDAYLNDINMLNVTHGHIRRFEEYKNLFKASGFSISKIEPLEDSMQLIELTP